MSEENGARRKVESICDGLWIVKRKLEAMGALIENQSKGAEYSSEELFGCGQILRGFAIEVAKIEEKLRVGEEDEI